MTEEEQDDLVATEIMGWRLYVGDGVDSWNPRTRWDHAGMLLDKLAESAILVELAHHEATGWECSIYLRDGTYHTNEPDDDGMCAPTGPAAIFEAAFATLEAT